MDTPVRSALAPLDARALDLLFRDARTFNAFLDTPVADATLLEAVRLAEYGPTAVNAVPARFVFVRSAEAKQKLAPHLSAGNRDKTVAAPVTAIVAYDLAFPETLARTFPHAPQAKSWFNEESAAATALHSGTLQAAYFILAARGLGLDAGPMAGFDKAGVDAAFFAGTTWRSNILINLGYGDRAKLHPRNPRLTTDEIVRFA
jgi:3-hydroxypropanoate dehydrogenase